MAEHDPDIDLRARRFSWRLHVSVSALRALTPSGDLEDALAVHRVPLFDQDFLALYDLLLGEERPGLREEAEQANVERILGGSTDETDVSEADIVHVLDGGQDPPGRGIARLVSEIIHRAITTPASRPRDARTQLEEHTRGLIERGDHGALLSYTCWLMDDPSGSKEHAGPLRFISDTLNPPPPRVSRDAVDEVVFPLDTARFDHATRELMSVMDAHTQARTWRRFTRQLLAFYDDSPRLQGWLDLLVATLGPHDGAHALTCLTVGLDLYHAGHPGPGRQLLDLANDRVNP